MHASVCHLTAALLYLQVQKFACQPFKDLYIDQRVGKNEQAAVTVRSKGVVALRAQAEGRDARREGAIRAAVPALPAPGAPCAAYLEAMEQAELAPADEEAVEAEESKVEVALADIDPDELSPREALAALYRLKGLCD